MKEFKEIPDKILEPFSQSDFVFIPISRGEPQALVSSKMNTLKAQGISFNVGLDSEEIIWNQFATKYIPKNYLIDKEGVIRYISTGYSSNSLDQIAKEIKKLLQ
ncbi:MAG: hypothetical protein WA775_01365 [Psychroserpens sp.]|uniref:TlpA family protein disulfide reductase n=1 Tax=Psychroserpens sp. TaxID=2020870 RepID=UPI003C971957